MIFIPVIIAAGLGSYFLFCGISNKPPFEDMQTGNGWDYSKFPNKYWAMGTGIVIIGVSIFITFLILQKKL